MGIFNFKGQAAAEKWKADLRDLNDETDVVLKQVADCIEEIKTESAGDPVEQLVITGAALADAAARMIDALRGLEDMIDNILKILIQAIADGVQSVADNRARSTDV